MQDPSPKNVHLLASPLSTYIVFGPRSDPAYLVSLPCNSSAFHVQPKVYRVLVWSGPSHMAYAIMVICSLHLLRL
jgi:hypothetical protein